MNLPRKLALETMELTKRTPKNDFLERHGIASPVALVPGALPDHARVAFPLPVLKLPKLKLPIELLVIWTIADFPGQQICSDYYNPRSAWYNVFYGAYGILSKKATCWGFKPNGDPDYDEMIKVPELDYNYLTAGQLGCPPAKQCFEVLSIKTDKKGQWSFAEVVCKVPSGLHKLEDAWDPHVNKLYYTIFGAPDPKLVAGHTSYEPVTMRGEMFFRKAVDAADKITLAWGAMCPDTLAGKTLLRQIIDAMTPDYP